MHLTCFIATGLNPSFDNHGFQTNGCGHKPGLHNEELLHLWLTGSLYFSGPTPEELEEIRRKEEEERVKKEQEEREEKERQEAQEAAERTKRQEEWVNSKLYLT